MPSSVIQGPDLTPQSVRQTLGKNGREEPINSVFETLLEHLAPSQPDALIDAQNCSQQHVGTDDERMNQTDDNNAFQPDLVDSLPLLQLFITQRAEQQMNRDMHAESHRGITLAKLAGWQPVDVNPRFMQASPEDVLEISAGTIGIAQRGIPHAGERDERSASKHEMIEGVLSVESPDLSHRIIRPGDDVGASAPDPSTDLECLLGASSPPSSNSVDLQVTSMPIEPSPARQLLSLIEVPLKPLLTSPTSVMGIQTQNEEVRVLRMTLMPANLGEVEVTFRRRGTEMQIRIAVSKQAAADALQGDLGFLKERIAALQPADGTHSILIMMSSPEGSVPTGVQPHFRNENDSIATGHGGPPSGGGERPSPRKEDTQSIVENEHHVQDTQSQLRADGIVV
jgi:hypothetical protein